MEKQIDDHGNVDGERELSDARTGFTRFVLLNERPPDGYTWPGWRRRRKQTTSRPDDAWPDMWKHMSHEAKKHSEAKMGHRETEARQCPTSERIFFIEPNDEEFKLTTKAARGKLEVPMPAAMPCKIAIKSSAETYRNVGKRKTKYVCVVDADESTRPRLEGAGHKPHQDHVTAKGTNSRTQNSLVHKFIPMPQASKIPNAKAAVEKEWEKLEKIPAWQLTKVRNKNKMIEETRNKGRKVHFATLMAAKVMDIKSRLPGWSRQAADAVSAHTQVTMEDAPTLLKIPKSECADIWIHLPTHKWPKSWSSMEDPVVLLETNLYGHLLAGLLWERQCEKVPLEHGW